MDLMDLLNLVMLKETKLIIKPIKLTVRIRRAGLHLSFKISKQILPNLSILGWYIFVLNNTLGGTIGYSYGKYNYK